MGGGWGQNLNPFFNACMKKAAKGKTEKGQDELSKC